jgi:hypothetical protein
MWIFVPAALYEAAGDERRWALRVEELRRTTREHGGGVRIEAAPRDLRLAVDPWGDLATSHTLNARVKRRFDPSGILKPKFFGVDL